MDGVGPCDKISYNGTFDCIASKLLTTGLLARDDLRFARNPSRTDAQRGDHFLQADLSGVGSQIKERERFRQFPIDRV